MPRLLRLNDVSFPAHDREALVIWYQHNFDFDLSIDDLAAPSEPQAPNGTQKPENNTAADAPLVNPDHRA